jgi:hypothetical protein
MCLNVGDILINPIYNITDELKNIEAKINKMREHIKILNMKNILMRLRNPKKVLIISKLMYHSKINQYMIG